MVIAYGFCLISFASYPKQANGVGIFRTKSMSEMAIFRQLRGPD